MSPTLKNLHRPRGHVAMVAGGIAAAGTVIAGTLGSAAGASTSRVDALVRSTRAAILSEKGVRLSSSSIDLLTHKVSETAIFDAGQNSSEQSYQTPTARLEIRVNTNGAYFSGNKVGLTSLLSVPANDVNKIGTKWVAITSKESQYKDFSSSDLATVPSDVLPSVSSEKTARLSTTSGRGKLDVLSWSITSNKEKEAFRLEIATGGRLLPVEETQTAGNVRQVTTFSHWGERVVVKTPTNTISFASLNT